jgi:hypothetical protein
MSIMLNRTNEKPRSEDAQKRSELSDSDATDVHCAGAARSDEPSNMICCISRVSKTRYSVINLCRAMRLIGMTGSLGLKAVTANGNMPAPMQPLNPASLGQLSGDDLVKLDNFNWPVPVVGRNRSFTATASKLLSTPSCNQWIE